MRIVVLNGANLDMLEHRDPEIYGGIGLSELETKIYQWALELQSTVRCRQTNHEGEFIERLHRVPESADAVIVNAGSWTHYSWAIRDALEPFEGTVIEVHISDVDAREEWRRHSVLEGLATERITGQGVEGYRRALELLAERRDA